MTGAFLANEAFTRSSASLVGIIIQSFPAVVLILSALIFKDGITPKQIGWIVIIFLGVFLCTVDFNDIKKKRLFADKGIRLALLSAVIFSIYFTFLRVFQNQYGWFWSNYISFMTFPVVIILVKRLFTIKEKLVIPHQKMILLAAFLSAFLLRSGDIALNVGVGSGLAAIVTPIASAAPTLFILISSLIFKDPVTKQQKIGIAVSLVGIILLSFFSK